MAKFKKLAIVSSSLLATAMLAGFGVGCQDDHTHAFETKTNADNTKTWYECTCGAKTPEEDVVAPHTHAFEVKTNTDGTKTWYECTCGAKTPEEDVVAPHTHDFEVKTSTDETKVWYECSCGAKTPEEDVVAPHVHNFELMSDEDAHWYECACEETIGKGDHIWDEGEETVAPEVDVEGEMTYTCQVCGETYTAPIDALVADPYVVAEGSATAANWDGVSVNVTLEAGDYVAIFDNDAVTCDPITVYEDGEVELYFSAWDMNVDMGEEIAFNYVIKKVPSVEITESYGEMEIVSYAWVKVSFTAPAAGKYQISSDFQDAYFAADPFSGGEYTYVFTATEENEVVEFYVHAIYADEDTASISYWMEELYPVDVVEGVNEVTLLDSTATEIKFVAPAAGAYKLATYDSSLVFYTVYDDANWDYVRCSQVNELYYFEATAADEEITLYVTGWYGNAAFAISEFPDEERYTSDVSFDEYGVGYASIKAGSSVNIAMPMMAMGAYKIAWYDENVSLSINGVAASTQSVVFGVSPRAMMSITATNALEEDVEVDFYLTAINGLEGIIDNTTEIFVSSMSIELPAQLEAGDYTMSVSSETALAVWGLNFETGEATAEIGMEPVTVTATGEIETLLVQGGMMPEMVILSIEFANGANTSEGDGSMFNPFIIATEGSEFYDLALPMNPMTGMFATLYFSYTAEEDGVLTISGVNNPGYIQDSNYDFVEFIEGTFSFNVVAGLTYTIEIGQQDMMGSPISPAFTFEV